MNKPSFSIALTDPDFGTDQWRRRVIHEQMEVELRQHQRTRFVGQIVFVLALMGAGAILYWAAAALGFDVDPDPRDMHVGSVIATAGLAIGVLALAVVLWDARLRLDRSKIELMRRDLDRYADREKK
jgi:hypothetical protein